MALHDVGAFWKPKSEGKVKLTGKLDRKKLREALKIIEGDAVSMMMFKNDKGDNPKRPDYRLCLVQDEKKEEDEPVNDDDVPF